MGEKSISTYISSEILTIPGWSENWLGVSWGSPGGPWGLLGGLWGGDPGGKTLEDDPEVQQADFWSPGGGPRVAPNACKLIQMLANGSWGSEISISRFF